MEAEVLSKQKFENPLMFVKCAGDIGFAVVDVETEQLVKHIGHGEYPHKATFHPNGKWAYLSFIVHSTIEVIDTKTLETVYVEKNMPKGSVGVNLSRDGRYLFVGSYGQIPGEGFPGISIFDTNFGETPELKLIKTIPIGRCGGVVVDSKNDLWVALTDANKVIRINGQPPFNVKQEIQVGAHPHDLVFCKELQILQVNHADEKYVTFLDTLNNEVIGHVPTGDNPHGGKFVISDEAIVCVVPSRKENVVSFIDIKKVLANRTSTGLMEDALIAQVDIGTPQGFVDATKDNRYAILDAYKATHVTIIDLQTYKIVKRVEVGDKPMHPQITHDGMKCFVDSMEEGTISVLDIKPLYEGNPDGVYVRTKLEDVGIQPSGNFFSYRMYLL
ncbi:MAG TPA: hypothetical protein GX497_04945 [Bacillus bacterium]|nr:hypothetical protein [Bacillus sp. (in: firmicutes)]